MDEALFEVGEYDHPEFHFDIYLDDEFAHEREDLVVALVADLSSAPGVQRAVHEDREKILISAPDATAQQLEDWLAGWFSRQSLWRGSDEG